MTFLRLGRQFLILPDLRVTNTKPHKVF